MCVDCRGCVGGGKPKPFCLSAQLDDPHLSRWHDLRNGTAPETQGKHGHVSVCDLKNIYISAIITSISYKIIGHHFHLVNKITVQNCTNWLVCGVCALCACLRLFFFSSPGGLIPLTVWIYCACGCLSERHEKKTVKAQHP